jgi:hypothetical protein
VSRVCCVQGLPCRGFILVRVCRVLGLYCPGFVMSDVCHVQGLSGFVMSGGLSCTKFVVSRDSLPRVYRCSECSYAVIC